MGDSAEDFILIGDVIDLLGFNDFCFLHDFNTGIFVAIFFLHQPHRPERPYIATKVPSPRMDIIS